VWLYFRDSGGDTQDTASQEDYGLAYCEHYKLRIDHVFKDAAISGESVTKRDEFGLMIELAHTSARPLVDGIIYWDTKRFARNQIDSQFFKSDLRRRGYKLISLSDNIPEGEMGILYEAFLEWKAQKDRDDISKDSIRGLAFIVGMKDANGNYLSIAPGRPPTFFRGEKYDTGLRRNDGRPRIVQRWVPDPETWEKGKLVFQMRSERASYKDIEAEARLFPDSIAPGGMYTTIFRNEIYIARFHFGGQVYENFVPVLATPEQWERVQALTYNRKKGYLFEVIHPKSGRGPFLLSGLCKCFYCQAAVWGSRNTRPNRNTFWRFYICSRKKARPLDCEGSQVSANKIESQVIDIISSQVLTIDFVDRLVEGANRFLSDTARIQEEIEAKKEKLQRVKAFIQRLIETIEMKPTPTLINRLEEREAERDQLQREIERLELRVKHTSLVIDHKYVAKFLGEMKDKLNGEEMEAKRLVLQTTLSKIEVGREVARLHTTFPLASHWLYSVPPTGIESNPMPILEVSLK
jgi:site-specific DNA recombinase